MDEAHQRLRVVVADERGRRLRANGLAAWLRRVAPAAARGTIGVAIVSDARMRTLNRTYRRQDYATDVLSFAAVARPARARAAADQTFARQPSALRRQRFLGEIVIARGVARRQAREAGHTELDELRLLALHGLLHLIGYDHERDDGRMRRVEARLRRKGGLRRGLIERAAES